MEYDFIQVLFMYIYLEDNTIFQVGFLVAFKIRVFEY